MDLLHPLISNSSSPLINLLGTVPSAPITTDITVTHIFYRHLSSIGRSKYLSLFSFSFVLTMLSAVTAKFTIRQVLFFFFLLIIPKSSLLIRIRWSVWISNSQRIVCVILFRSGYCLNIHYFVVWSNLSLLHNSRMIFFLIQSCRISYSFCASFLNLLITWL